MNKIQTTTLLDILLDILLNDPDGNCSKVIGIRGAEAGLDHIEITTQSQDQKEGGVKSIRRIYAEEVSM